MKDFQKFKVYFVGQFASIVKQAGRRNTKHTVRYADLLERTKFCVREYERYNDTNSLKVLAQTMEYLRNLGLEKEMTENQEALFRNWRSKVRDAGKENIL